MNHHPLTRRHPGLQNASHWKAKEFPAFGTQQKQAKKGRIDCLLDILGHKQVPRAPSTQSLRNKGSTIFILAQYFKGFANSLYCCRFFFLRIKRIRGAWGKQRLDGLHVLVLLVEGSPADKKAKSGNSKMAQEKLV